MSITPAPVASPPPPPTWTPPPAAKPARRLLLVVVAVVIVAAVVLAGLYFAGIGPFAFAKTKSSSGNNGSGTAGSFSQAAATAKPSVSSVNGGPWTLVGGIGIQVTTAVPVNTTDLNATSSGGGCGAKILPAASSVTSIPSSSSAPSSGLTNAWIILYANATNGVLEVAVFSGTATPIITLGIYGGCATGVTGLSLPSGYIDSPAAGQAAANAGGSSFQAKYSAVDVEYILVPSVTTSFGDVSISATWDVEYTTCDLGADNGKTLNGASPAQFIASINATSGTLIQSENTSAACASASGSSGGGKTPLSTDCYTIPFQEQYVGSTYWNNGTLACSIDTLTAGDLTIAVENNSTSAAVSTTGFTLQIYNFTGMVVVSTYDFATNTWSTPGTPVGFSFYDEWVLTTPSSMVGNKLVVSATSSAPVTGSVVEWLDGG
ncbi:MAG: hypothetical protein WCB18_07580 [Thermoplasmata archaeon]